MNTTRNVRFWHMTPRANWVRLTVRPGEPLEIHSRWHNGEGISWECEKFQISHGEVINHWGRGGRDCDGRSGAYGISACKIENLSARESWDKPGLMIPQWEEKESGEYDEYAERAGF